MRTLAQVLTEEYSEHGVHVANNRDRRHHRLARNPGVAQRNQNRRDHVINPVKIAEAFYYLHTRTFVLDTRASTQPISDQAELLTARRRSSQPRRGRDQRTSSAAVTGGGRCRRTCAR